MEIAKLAKVKVAVEIAKGVEVEVAVEIVKVVEVEVAVHRRIQEGCLGYPGTPLQGPVNNKFINYVLY